MRRVQWFRAVWWPPGSTGATGTRRPIRFRFPLYRLFRTFYLDRLTDAGRALFWMLLLASAVGHVTYVVKLYLVFCVLAGLFVASGVLARLARVPLEVNASFPDRTAAGSRVPVPVTVRNPTARGALDVVLRLPAPPRPIRLHPRDGIFLATLPPGEERVVELALEPLRRGSYTLPGIRRETLFPWGLWRDSLPPSPPHSLLVSPWFHPLRTLDIPVGKRYQPGGIALSSYLGDSTEFISTREFREGDPIRAIHWRSWARLGIPVVKEFQEEYFCRIALLLDTFRREEDDRGWNPFEAALSLAAAVADSLSREEYVIDLFAAGPEIYYLQAGRSLAYLDNVLDILACLEPCREPPFEKITPLLLDHLGRITTTILVLLDWDERREELVRLIRDLGSAVKVIVIRDAPCSRDPAGLEGLTGPVVRLTAEDVRRGVAEL